MSKSKQKPEEENEDSSLMIKNKRSASNFDLKLFVNDEQDNPDLAVRPVPGKLATRLTKPTETQQDLALAYSPGVAEPVRRIAQNPDDVFRYTQRGNLVGVLSNGTAVLGLGNVGPPDSD